MFCKEPCSSAVSRPTTGVWWSVVVSIRRKERFDKLSDHIRGYSTTEVWEKLKFHICTVGRVGTVLFRPVSRPTGDKSILNQWWSRYAAKNKCLDKLDNQARLLDHRVWQGIQILEAPAGRVVPRAFRGTYRDQQEWEDLWHGCIFSNAWTVRIMSARQRIWNCGCPNIRKVSAQDIHPKDCPSNLCTAKNMTAP